MKHRKGVDRAKARVVGYLSSADVADMRTRQQDDGPIHLRQRVARVPTYGRRKGARQRVYLTYATKQRLPISAAPAHDTPAGNMQLLDDLRIQVSQAPALADAALQCAKDGQPLLGHQRRDRGRPSHDAKVRRSSLDQVRSPLTAPPGSWGSTMIPQMMR